MRRWGAGSAAGRRAGRGLPGCTDTRGGGRAGRGAAPVTVPRSTCARHPPTFKKPICRAQGASAVCGTPRPGHGSDTLAGSAEVPAACRAPLPVVPDSGLRGAVLCAFPREEALAEAGPGTRLLQERDRGGHRAGGVPLSSGALEPRPLSPAWGLRDLLGAWLPVWARPVALQASLGRLALLCAWPLWVATEQGLCDSGRWHWCPQALRAGRGGGLG